MATELGVAYLSVAASTGGLGRDIESRMGNVGSSAGQRLGGGIVSSARSAIAPLAGILGVAALGKFGASAIKVGVQTASGMEQAKISFTTMLGSAKKADSFIKQMVDFAAKTPFEMTGLQTAASSLISAGIDASKVIPIMTTLGDVTSGMGTGSEGIQRATIALQQMNAAGRITGEDLNQLRDAGIPVFDLLAAATGKSKAEVTKLAQSGKLGKKELDAMMKALETGKGLERFNGLMDKQSQSLQGLWSTMKDTFAQGMSSVIGPLMPIMKDGLAKLTPMLAAALGGLSASVAGVAASLPSVLNSLSSSGAGALAGLATAFSPVGLAMKAILPILPQIMGAFGQLGGQLASTLLPVLGTIAPVVQQVVGALAGGLQQVILALLPVLTQIASAVLPVVGQVIAAIVPLVTQLVEKFAGMVPILSQLVSSLLPPIGSLIAGLSTAITPLIGAFLVLAQALMPLFGIALPAMSRLIGPLSAMISALVPPIVAVVGQIAGALVPVFEAVGELVSALMPIISGLIDVIAGIIGAVMPVVAVIAGALVPILGTVIGWLAKIVTAIVKFVADGIKSIGSWAKGISDGISKAVGFFMDLRGKIGEVFKGAATWLVDSGANLLKGLWNGISDTVGWLKDQIGNAMTGVIDSVKHTFGIKSPSKVFRKIGTQLNAGLAAGIVSSTSSATSAISKVAKLVTDTAAKAIGKSAKKQAKAAAKAANALLNYQKSGKKGTLSGIAAQREALADRIKDANDALADQISARNQMRDSVASSISGELDLASALAATTSTSQQTSILNGATVSRTVTTTSGGGFAGIAAHVAGLAAKAKAFAGRLKSLIQAGYPAGLVQEVAGLGTANGISVADALLSASSADQGSLISDFSSLMSWSSEAGSYVADQMYGVGIAAQQGIVNGLLSDDAKLVEAAEAVAAKLTDAVKKKLGIKSPSTVFRDEVGLMVAKGAAQGIDRGASIVAAAGRGLIGPLDNAAFGSRAESDRPVVMDGRIVAWIKQTATGAARLVLADESLNAQVAMA